VQEPEVREAITTLERFAEQDLRGNLAF